MQCMFQKLVDGKTVKKFAFPFNGTRRFFTVGYGFIPA
jgi:hypothetical protein